jgi:Tol biopolymer transport system component
VDEAATRTVKGMARPTSSAEFLVSEIKRHKAGAIVAFAALVLVASGISLGWYWFASRNRPSVKPGAPFQTMKITRLTNNGKTNAAAVSPDGKLLVYVMEDAGQQSLWIRQLATNSTVQIALPSDLLRQKALYKGLTFSRDGNYIFLLSGDRTAGSLYRMPAFGGVAKKIIEDVDTPVTFSPDDKRLAFVRYYPIPGETSLIVANADGTGEQRLATRRDDGFPLEGPGWSPDGKVIACAARNSHGADSYATVVGVGVEDGAETPFTSQRWGDVGRLVWLLDGSGLLMPAMDRGSGPFKQIWHLSYPKGDARRITNDLNDYSDVSLTGDSSNLFTVSSDQHSNMWVAPNGDSARAIQVSSNNSDGAEGIFWAPNGKIVYTSNVSGNEDLWIMNADGSGQKQLTTETGRNFAPSVSPDGHYILFLSDRAGTQNVWRMEIDGTNPKQLLTGSEGRPSYSPDGRWMVYVGSNSPGVATIWKVSVDGGTPVQLTDSQSGKPAISSDGKQIACGYFDNQTMDWRIALVPFEGGKPTRMFDIPASMTYAGGIARWTADGRALTYIGTRGGVSNIWRLRLDGSPPQQLTDFKVDRIFWFDWSHDDKQLALARGTVTNDVVLISNFKGQQ